MFIEVQEKGNNITQNTIPLLIPPLDLVPPPVSKNITLEQKILKYSYIPKQINESLDGISNKNIEFLLQQPLDKADYYLCESCNNWTKHSQKQFHEKYHSSKIEEGVYLGSALNSSSIKELRHLNITRILNCSVEVPNYFQNDSDYVYKNLELRDSFGQTIKKYLDQCVLFIQQSKASNKNILIHCAMGKSRSATVTLYYLMVTKQYSLKQAYDHVLSKRPIVTPNPSYVKQLLEIEIQLYGKNSIKPEEIRPAYKHITTW